MTLPPTSDTHPVESPANVRRSWLQRAWGVAPDALLSGTLLYIILFFQFAVVYSLAILPWFMPLGIPRSDIDTPLWLDALGILVGGVSLMITFRPIRRSVDYLIYGQHGDPYGVISRVGQRLEIGQSPQAIADTVAEAIAATLKLPYVAVETRHGMLLLNAAYGELPGHATLLTVPLVYREATIGVLRVAPRHPSDPALGVDRQLLDDLARQVAITLYAAQVTAELQASRERIVTAREEERRRIRRDLHDGLGPLLSALQLQLGALRLQIRQDPAQAEALAGELRDELRAATGEIRRLVYDLRPPMLDELGLVGAVRNLGATLPQPTLTLHAPESLPALSAALEVALYRIAAEAVNNVVKHAQATHCTVDLALAAGAITLTVTDDGRGLPDDYALGVGLTSMRERAAELGGKLTVANRPTGGVRVIATLPYALSEVTEAVSHDG